MKYDSENNGLEMVIRTKGYRIILDIRERVLTVTKSSVQDDWSICIRCADGGEALC